MEEFLLYTLAGFVAQLIDGALGMAYGVTATSILLAAGVSPIILGLAVGGLIATPLGAWACKRLPVKPFMMLVGMLIMLLSIRTLHRSQS
jgi:uncharacterized membrane protein YfcA